MTSLEKRKQKRRLRKARNRLCQRIASKAYEFGCILSWSEVTPFFRLFDKYLNKIIMFDNIYKVEEYLERYNRIKSFI